MLGLPFQRHWKYSWMIWSIKERKALQMTAKIMWCLLNVIVTIAFQDHFCQWCMPHWLCFASCAIYATEQDIDRTCIYSAWKQLAISTRRYLSRKFKWMTIMVNKQLHCILRSWTKQNLHTKSSNVYLFLQSCKERQCHASDSIMKLDS